MEVNYPELLDLVPFSKDELLCGLGALLGTLRPKDYPLKF